MGRGAHFRSAYTIISVSRRGKSEQEFKAGSWRRELKQRPWRAAADWLALHGCSSTAQKLCPGVTLPIVVGLSVIYPRKWPPRLAYRAVSHSIFSVEVPLPSDLSLCQVDKIINQHTIFASVMWGLEIEVRPQALPSQFYPPSHLAGLSICSLIQLLCF